MYSKVEGVILCLWHLCQESPPLRPWLILVTEARHGSFDNASDIWCTYNLSTIQPI